MLSSITCILHDHLTMSHTGRIGRLMRRRYNIMPRLKIFWVLITTLGLLAFIGHPSLVMANHATHFVSDKGPRFPLNESGCYICHADAHDQCGEGGPFFRSGADTNGDEKYNLSETDVCDDCHSPGGSFNGVGDLDLWNTDSLAFGAKLNWQMGGVYDETGSTLKLGKQNWCAGCHDNDPAYSRSQYQEPGPGSYASNVMGDNVTYGYNASGHGRSDIGEPCGGTAGGCHDLTAEHIKHDGRTYQASIGNYMAGYRLNADMAVPRYAPDTGDDAFGLCFNCHESADVFGTVTNFRDDNENEFYHDYHLREPITGSPYWDSDVDGVVDSLASCTTCHNVHGSPMDLDPDPEIDDFYPNPVMIRHGELIGHPKGFDFHWYDAAYWDPDKQWTSLFESSMSGEMLVSDDLAYNGVCDSEGCHTGAAGYSRAVAGTGTIVINDIMITEKFSHALPPLHPGQVACIMVNFCIFGPTGTMYVVKSPGSVSQITGANWQLNLGFEEPYPAEGTYSQYYFWYKDIPLDAMAPDSVQVKVRLKLFDEYKLQLLDKDTRTEYFPVEPW